MNDHKPDRIWHQLYIKGASVNLLYGIIARMTHCQWSLVVTSEAISTAFPFGIDVVWHIYQPLTITQLM